MEKLSLSIDKSTTALVIIDLQKGIVERETAPYPSTQVVKNAAALAKVCRKNRLPVFLVRVATSPDRKDALQPVTDQPVSVSTHNRSTDWSEIVPELGPEPTGMVITKHQWGAFYGTELDLQLRRRGITTIILCGISTNIGVESTARFAYEYGYQQIFAEDAMASGKSVAEHAATTTAIFPRIGRVRATAEILEALK